LDGAYDGAPASNWLLESTARVPAGSSKFFEVERYARHDTDVMSRGLKFMRMPKA
jgi:hypothetical protein